MSDIDLPAYTRPYLRSQCVFGHITPELILSLKKYIGSRKVLEVYAGQGYLTYYLREQGITIQATSLFNSHDATWLRGTKTRVEEKSCLSAVKEYSGLFDILLVVWPTTDEDLAKSVQYLSKDIPIIFIGEITDYDQNFLGGCATDKFFAQVEERHEESCLIEYDRGGIGCDRAAVFYRK
ncbi:hypothetical protein [Neptuniibacter sp. QD37_11]|uniref:hypothetical protein n=1 Tax=Neptuniibacter sp. QD37_11 TaxID=3398209 RepID=UPI0039F45924